MKAENLVERNVFVTGGRGFMGRQLIGEWLRRGRRVRSRIRPRFERKVPAGSEAGAGDPLSVRSIEPYVAPMSAALVLAAENPLGKIRIVNVPEIRKAKP